MTNGMPDPMDLYRKATSRASELFAGTKPAQLHAQTPCTEWDVATLMRHFIGGQQFTGRLLKGDAADGLGFGSPATIEPIDADLGKLSDAYAISLESVMGAVRDPSSMSRNIVTPAGEMTGGQFLVPSFMDQMIRSWDLAKATGQDNQLDPGLVEACHNMFVPTGAFEGARAHGLIGPKIDVPESANLQSKLLGVSWPPGVGGGRRAAPKKPVHLCYHA